MNTIMDRVTAWSGYILFMLAAMLSAVACSHEDLPSPGGGTGEETLVRLTIRTPGVSVPRPAAATRSADTEYVIGTVKVVVFEKRDDGKYYYRYMADGQNVTQQDGQKTTFHALLKGTSAPVKLLLVANYGDAFSGYSPHAGDPEAEVRSALVSSFVFQPGMQLPMYAEVTLDRLSTETTNTISAVMLRSIARADVTADLDEMSNRFRITEAYVYRGRSLVQIAPDIAALSASETPRVDKPSVPSADTVAKYSKTTMNPLLLEGLYLPECEPVENDEAAQLKGVSCVVVGGLYEDDTSPTYYRVDFNSGTSGHPFGQVLRNHRYEFVITKVTGRGWEDPDDAANNRATTIVAEVKQWQDFTLEMHANGDNYFGISSRELVLPYMAGQQKSLFVQSTVTYSMTWLDDNDQPVGETVTAVNTPISNQYFMAEIVREPGFDDDESRIVFTSLSDNTTNNDRKSRMLVRWGDWKFYITVTQESFKAHTREVVNVLSAFYGTAGHLGYGSDPKTADARSMRQILSNPDNFSVRGRVNYFAGFVFNCTSNVKAFQDPNGTNSETEVLRAMLMATDVLYLGNDNRISAAAARMVMEWLEADEHRVLIVGADSPGTSHNLLRSNRDYLGLLESDVDYWYGTTWFENYHYDNLGFGVNKCMVPATHTTQNKIFTEGVFGSVGLGSTYAITDEYYGYAKTYKSSIVPLIVHVNYRNYMLVGVDKERRIIYHGDASLFQHAGDRMSAGAYNYGTINNDLDLLWANMWAWIAHQVVWGNAG